MAKPNLAEPLNLVIGSGQVLIGFEDGNGNVTSFKYRAQSALTLNVAPETADIPDDDTPSAEVLLVVQNQTTRGGSLTIKDWTEEMAAAYFLGTTETVTQAATPVVDEAGVAALGAYIYFGKAAGNGGGAKNVSAVSITDASDIAFSAGTDYVMTAEDLKKGRAWIPLTSTMTEGEALKIDYTPAAETRNRVKSGSLPAKGAWLIFESDYSNGDAEEVNLPKVKLIPTGEVTLKDRENPRAMQFDLKIETRTGYEQVYIDDEAA